MRNFLAGVVATVLSAAALALAVYFIILPRLDWSADQEPPKLEMLLVAPVIGGWVGRNAPAATNPLAATAENLAAARDEYGEHCAPCHGLDGSGRNHFGAVFYPPVARLDGDTQQLSDAQLYFIVKKGFASTGMPAFGANHSDQDLWRMVLWVRHLGALTPQEKSELEKQTTESEHDR